LRLGSRRDTSLPYGPFIHAKNRSGNISPNTSRTQKVCLLFRNDITNEHPAKGQDAHFDISFDDTFFSDDEFSLGNHPPLDMSVKVEDIGESQVSNDLSSLVEKSSDFYGGFFS